MWLQGRGERRRVKMAGAFNFNEVVKGHDVALPFILVFTIVFAVLQKIQLFGTNSRKINVMVALVTAFFTVRVPAIVSTMNMFLPKVSLILLVILMVLLVIGLFGMKGEEVTGITLLLLFVIAVVGLGWAYFSSSTKVWLPDWLRSAGSDVYIMAAIIIGILIIIWFLSSEPKSQGIGKWVEDLPKYFGRK